MSQKAWDVGCGMWEPISTQMIWSRVIRVGLRRVSCTTLESCMGTNPWTLGSERIKLPCSSLEETSGSNHPRTFALFDQLRRAALSVPANIVEGYALGTPALYRKHLRIALGSAAETEYFLRVAADLGYLPAGVAKAGEELLGGAMRALYGLIRRPESHRLSHTPHPTPHAS